MRDFQDCFGVSFVWEEDGACADIEGKHEGIAESVGVEELGGREGDVVGIDTQDFDGVVFAAVDPVAVLVHGGFGATGAAGGPEPEGDVVGVCFGGAEFGGIAAEPIVPEDVAGLGIADYDHVAKMRLFA